MFTLVSQNEGQVLSGQEGPNTPETEIKTDINYKYLGHTRTITFRRSPETSSTLETRIYYYPNGTRSDPLEILSLNENQVFIDGNPLPAGFENQKTLIENLTQREVRVTFPIPIFRLDDVSDNPYPYQITELLISTRTDGGA